VIAVALAVTTLDPLSFLGGQRERGLQVESLAAWPFLVARLGGAPVEVVYRYGAHEIDAPGVGVVAGGVLVLTLALLGVVGVQRLRGALDPVPGADVALATVLFTVATSRVFSGQYFIWLLALAAVTLGDPASRMRRTTALLIGAGVATQLVYPWLYSALLDGNPVAVAVQTVRVGLTLAATVVALEVILRPAGASAQPAGSVPPASVPPSASPPSASGSPPSSITRNRSAERSHPHDDSTH
jgi:hypothetical protein